MLWRRACLARKNNIDSLDQLQWSPSSVPTSRRGHRRHRPWWLLPFRRLVLAPDWSESASPTSRQVRHNVNSLFDAKRHSR